MHTNSAVKYLIALFSFIAFATTVPAFAVEGQDNVCTQEEQEIQDTCTKDAISVCRVDPLCEHHETTSDAGKPYVLRHCCRAATENAFNNCARSYLRSARAAYRAFPVEFLAEAVKQIKTISHAECQSNT